MMDATLAVSSAVLLEIRDWLSTHFDVPTVTLVLLMYGTYRILKSAQRRKDVDLVDILRNADMKISFLPSAGIGAFMFSTWALMHDTLAGTLTDPQWYGYLLFWSGAPVANALANKWTGELPWSKRQ